MKFKVLWQGQLPKVSVFWTLWTVPAFRVYRLSVNQKNLSLQSCFRANLIKQCSILEYICCVWRVFAHFVPIQIDHYFSCQLKQGRYSCIPHPKKRGTIWLMPEWFLLTTIFTMERSDRDPYKAISVCTLFTGCHFLSVWNRHFNSQRGERPKCRVWLTLVMQANNRFSTFFPPLCLDIKQRFDWANLTFAALSLTLLKFIFALVFFISCGLCCCQCLW